MNTETAYKIINALNIKLPQVFIFLFLSVICQAQNTTVNQYGLVVIGDVETYKLSVAGNDSLKLVDLKNLIPHIQTDLRYATANNFLHKKLYAQPAIACLRLNAAVRLAIVADSLKKMGLGLKIFDAYRPYAVTEKMWEAVKDDRYAADPKFGSGHNRGIATDLTIVNLKTKKELNMGTGFDNFTDSAHHDFEQLPESVLKNRLLLRRLMEGAGFKALETEWWHYSLPDAKNYPLMNISFSDIKKLSAQ